MNNITYQQFSMYIDSKLMNKLNSLSKNNKSRWEAYKILFSTIAHHSIVTKEKLHIIFIIKLNLKVYLETGKIFGTNVHVSYMKYRGEGEEWVVISVWIDLESNHPDDKVCRDNETIAF